jgi:cell division protein FtsB
VRGIWVLPALLGLALAHAALDEDAGLRRWQHLRGELADSQQRIAALRAEIAALRAESERLEGEAFAIEKAIREELGLARPGQTIVRMRRDEVPSAWIP